MCRNHVRCLSCLSCVTLIRGFRVITWLCTVNMADCSKCIHATYECNGKGERENWVKPFNSVEDKFWGKLYFTPGSFGDVSDDSNHHVHVWWVHSNVVVSHFRSHMNIRRGAWISILIPLSPQIVNYGREIRHSSPPHKCIYNLNGVTSTTRVSNGHSMFNAQPATETSPMLMLGWLVVLADHVSYYQ